METKVESVGKPKGNGTKAHTEDNGNVQDVKQGAEKQSATTAAPGVLKEVKKATFLSLYKAPLYFITEHRYLHFANGMWETTDPEEIEFLRNHLQFGQTLWEEQYPEWVIDKKKKDKEWIRLVNEEEEDEFK